MIDDALDMGFVQQLRSRHRHFMNQKIGAGTVFNNAFIVPGIAPEITAT
jgi:hypothetical protein